MKVAEEKLNVIPPNTTNNVTTVLPWQDVLLFLTLSYKIDSENYKVLIVLFLFFTSYDKGLYQKMVSSHCIYLKKK